MPYRLSRRTFLTGAGLGIAAVDSLASSYSQSKINQRIAALETQLGGRIGFAALDTSGGKHIAYRGDERFAMCSTFKWTLAAMVLAKAADGEFTLDQHIPYSADDLLDYAPVTKEYVAQGFLPVAALSQAIVEVSDNTAANLLLQLVGGPARLTSYLRQQGDAVTRLDRTEPTLNTNLPNDDRDTTTSNAMVKTMNAILVGDALSSVNREQLLSWMKACRTGLSRLRAGVPKNWIVGDKTGNGANGSANDVAIMWPPKHAPILVAAYLSGSQAALDEMNAVHVKLANIVGEVFA